MAGEAIMRMVLFRELEQILDGGFTGDIVLHCQFGEVKKYNVNEVRKPGMERRTAGPRDGDDRSKH